ncbi:MAG: TetR/AcrR family transcriptional regulator [Catenulispora sp.]
MENTNTDSLQKRKLIAQAAVSRFVKQGFSKTSLQDIAQESGLPPEVVHELFPSTIDVLRLAGNTTAASAYDMLSGLLQETSLASAAELVGRSAEFISAVGDPMRMAPQIWGVAAYDGEIHGLVTPILVELQNYWIALAKRMSDEGRLLDGADPDDVGRTLACLITGFMVHSVLNDMQPGHVSRGLQALAR